MMRQSRAGQSSLVPFMKKFRRDPSEECTDSEALQVDSEAQIDSESQMDLEQGNY